MEYQFLASGMVPWYLFAYVNNFECSWIKQHAWQAKRNQRGRPLWKKTTRCRLLLLLLLLSDPLSFTLGTPPNHKRKATPLLLLWHQQNSSSLLWIFFDNFDSEACSLHRQDFDCENLYLPTRLFYRCIELWRCVLFECRILNVGDTFKIPG